MVEMERLWKEVGAEVLASTLSDGCISCDAVLGLASGSDVDYILQSVLLWK